MRSVGIALAAGLVIVALAVAAVLSQSPSTVLASNSVKEEVGLHITTAEHARICQAGEYLPRGTVFIRSPIEAFTGPRMRVEALSGGDVITSGELGSGWSGRGLAIRVKAVHRSVSNVTICFSSNLVNEPLDIIGSHSAQGPAVHTSEGVAVEGRMAIAYLGNGRSSWFSLVPSVARNMGLGRAWSGTWVAPFVLMLMLAAATLSAIVILRAHDE